MEDGKSKKEWQDFGSITVAQRMVNQKVRGRVPFIPLEAKGGGLDQCQVLV